MNKKYKDTLFMININEHPTSQLQKQLYYIFELNDESNFGIVFTDKVDCIDNMEKRVRSRFNDEIIFFPLTTIRRNKRVKANYDPIPTIQYNNTMMFISKYLIKDVSIFDLYEILSPEHLALLILSKKQKIDHITFLKSIKSLF